MKSFENILAAGEIQISDFENYRKEQLEVLRKQAMKGAIAGSLIFASAVLISILSYNGWVMVVGFIFGIIVFLVIRGGITGKLKLSFKEQLIKRMIELVDPSFEYHPRNCISRDVFKKSQFLKGWSYYTGEDLFKGIYNETETEFSELHITQRSDKSQVTVFKGPFYLIRTEKEFAGRTTVVPDYAEKLLGKFGRGLQKLNFSRDKVIRIDDPEFEKDFAVYSDNEDEAKTVLNPNMIRFLSREQRKAKQVFFGFSEKNIYLGIYNSRDLYKVNIKEEITENTLKTIYDELRSNLELIEELHILILNAG